MSGEGVESDGLSLFRTLQIQRPSGVRDVPVVVAVVLADAEEVEAVVVVVGAVVAVVGAVVVVVEAVVVVLGIVSEVVLVEGVVLVWHSLFCFLPKIKER